MAEEAPFWETVALRDMTEQQWESLCDGCGRCCLHKLQDEYSGRIFYTAVACRLLDSQSCRCRDYDNRKSVVPGCVVLGKSDLGALSWLPDTCAYRRLDEGKTLPDWHPLRTGDRQSVHSAGVSVRGRTVSEENVHEEDYEEFVVQWIEPTHYDGEVASQEDNA